MAFTLIELLCVIAVIAILATLLLPALTRSKSKAQGVRCLANNKELVLAWRMYADDNAGRLPPNRAGSNPALPGWALGVENWDLLSNNTNVLNLVGSNALLAAYTSKSLRVYKCPADNFLSTLQRSAGWTERLRSYSMSSQIGEVGDPEYDSPAYRRFLKETDITQPSPSKCWVFVDEHADSINDGWFWVLMDKDAWYDLPASYHNGAGSIAFADGHGEIKKWLNSYTKQPVVLDVANARWQAAQPPNQLADIRWVQERTSTQK